MANSSGSWWSNWTQGSNSSSASVEDGAEANADVTLNQVLEVVDLSAETKEFITDNYPTLEEFEKFVKLLFDGGKTLYETHEHGEFKKPRFKRSDSQEFIILRRWTEKKKQIDWGSFNEESFNDLREQAPKHDLLKVLKELGIDNEKVLNTLKAKKIEKLVHFVQKPKSWYSKLEEESDKEENEQQQQQQPNQLPLNGSEQIAIEKFKEWYHYHSIGFLPSNWIDSFHDHEDVLLKERELRKILRMIGLNADAIQALEMNDIKDIEDLNYTSKNWRSETKSRTVQMGDGEQESPSDEWKLMGLTQNDARRIIRFRHWHTFYVAGKPNMKNWPKEFNSAHFNEFVQRYMGASSGDDFKKPSRWKFWKHDSLNLSQEKHDYYDVLQKAAEAGEVTSEQRYHLLNYMDKKEKMLLIDDIISSHYEGRGDSTLEEDRLRELLQLDEQKADEKEKSDLLFGQQFCQFYFGAVLAFVLLYSWVGTTIFFMVNANEEREGVTFIHNVLFGLVTAVVVQELGEGAKETSLYHRILSTYRDHSRRQKERSIINRRNGSSSCCSRIRKIWGFIETALMCIILWSTRVYIIVWMIFGIISLAFGAINVEAHENISNPLYVTGQTWLGVAVTISYTFFGLSGNNTGAVQGINDGRGIASDRDEATRSSVATNHHEHSI